MPGNTSGSDTSEVEEAAAGPPGAHDDPGEDRGHQHDDDGGSEREHGGVADHGRDVRIGDDGAVGIEGEVLERGERRRTVEFLQRAPYEHEEGQHHDDHEIGDEHGRGDIAPSADAHPARPEALAGHRGESPGIGGDPRLRVDAERRDDEQRHAVGGGEADLARIFLDRLVDRRRIDLDADRKPEQRRDLERFDGAHEQDEEGRQRRRPGEPQRHPPYDLAHAWRRS